MYYWILYKNTSHHSGERSQDSIVVNVHPFEYIPNAGNVSFLILNWKEISEEEFNRFKGKMEILPEDYSFESRIKEINDRMNSYYTS